jgi:hypothetical protein
VLAIDIDRPAQRRGNNLIFHIHSSPQLKTAANSFFRSKSQALKSSLSQSSVFSATSDEPIKARHDARKITAHGFSEKHSTEILITQRENGLGFGSRLIQLIHSTATHLDDVVGGVVDIENNTSAVAFAIVIFRSWPIYRDAVMNSGELRHNFRL